MTGDYPARAEVGWPSYCNTAAIVHNKQIPWGVVR